MVKMKLAHSIRTIVRLVILSPRPYQLDVKGQNI